MTDQHEFAFDVKLLAVVRITAKDEASAWKRLREFDAISDFNRPDMRLTEASVDDVSPHLFEVDGKDVDF